MKLEFKATRWNCRRYQVNGCGDGFFCVLILGEHCHEISLSRTPEEAMEKAQQYEDLKEQKKLGFQRNRENQDPQLTCLRALVESAAEKHGRGEFNDEEFVGQLADLVEKMEMGGLGLRK